MSITVLVPHTSIIMLSTLVSCHKFWILVRHFFVVCVLIQVVRCNGQVLLEYIPDIKRVLQLTVHVKCKDGSDLAGTRNTSYCQMRSHAWKITLSYPCKAFMSLVIG